MHPEFLSLNFLAKETCFERTLTTLQKTIDLLHPKVLLQKARKAKGHPTTSTLSSRSAQAPVGQSLVVNLA